MRKGYIRSLLKHLNFESIIVKYDYFIEGKLDYVLCDIKDTESYYFYKMIPLPDGRIITNLPNKEYLVLWGLKDDKPDIMLRYGKNNSRTFELFQSNKLVAGSIYGPIRIHDVNNNENSIIGNKDCIKAIYISMDNRIIVLTFDNEIKIWNPKTGNVDLIILIRSHRNCDPIVTTQNHIIFPNWNSIMVHDIHTGELKFDLIGDKHRITDIKILSSELILTASRGYLLRLWNINTGKCEKILEGHKDAIRCLLILQDGRIVSGSNDNSIIIWKDYQIQFVLKNDSPIILLNTLIDNRLISVTMNNENMRIWDTDTGKCEVTFPNLHEKYKDINSIITTTDGKIITGGSDGKIIVWK